MKKALILSLVAFVCIASQAQKKKDITVRANSLVLYTGLPNSSTDEKTGLKTIEWPSTENNSWHENIGIIDKVPVVEDVESIYGKANMAIPYMPMKWTLTDEGKKTVLHCYFMMKADVVTNLWLGNAETTILDKETGIIYQAQSTIPERCYNKGTVDRASHHRHRNGLLAVPQFFFHLVCQRNQIDIGPPAGGTGHNARSLIPYTDGFEDVFRRRDFPHRIVGQGYANGVSNPIQQKGADAHGGLQHSHPHRAGLCHADVQRIVAPAAEQPCRRYHGGHIRGLHGQAGVVKPVFFQIF